MGSGPARPVKVPGLIEIRADGHGTHRLWIDGEPFPWPVGELRTGPVSRREMPSVTVTIPAFRVTVDHDSGQSEARSAAVAVVAGNWEEYDAWCRTHKVQLAGADPFYATAQALQGRGGVAVARIGTWQDRPDLAEVERALAVAAVGSP